MLQSGFRLALLRFFHEALRLTRCMHGHRLANLVTTCGCFCLRLQRKLLRFQCGKCLGGGVDFRTPVGQVAQRRDADKPLVAIDL